MKKLLKKILGSCLGFAMAIGIGVAAINNKDINAANAASPASLNLSAKTWTAGTNYVSWSISDSAIAVATMKSSGTNYDNYLGGDTNKRTSSRFYNGGTVEIQPASGITLGTITFTATSDGYASTFAGSTWTNASVSSSSSTVTITPTDGTLKISVSVTGTCGFTSASFAYTSGTGGSSLVINTTNFTKTGTGSGYATYNGSRSIGDFVIYSNQVMVQSSKLQFQSNNGWLKNSTSFGKILNITLETTTNLTIYLSSTEFSSKPTSGTTTTSGSSIEGTYGYFAITGGGSTPTTSTITVNYTAGYTVTFDLQGHGSAISSQTIASGGKVTKPTDPTAAGYTFGGWYKEAGCKNAWNFDTDTVTATTILYAKWTINSYTVTFNVQGHGSAPDSQSIQYGAKVTKPSDPSETGYTFGGWYKEAGCTNAWVFDTDTVTAATILYAKWTINTYTVTANIENGDIDDDSSIEYGGDLAVQIVPSFGFVYPSEIEVTMDEVDITEDVLYDSSDGSILYVADETGGVTGDIVITASCGVDTSVHYITTNITNGTATGDTYFVDGESGALISLVPNDGYKVPASLSNITVTNCDDWDYADGLISINNSLGDGNITISATCPALETYSISVTETNGSHTGPSTIKEKGSATLVFTPTLGYVQPSDVTVSGATKSWSNGTLTLTNPTGAVSVTYTAEVKTLISISVSPNSGSYTLGDEFVLPTVTATYNSGNETVTDTENITFTGYDAYTTGEQTVTIGYGGKTTTYTATVSNRSITIVTTYNKVTASKADWSGKYLFLNANNGYVMNNTISSNRVTNGTLSDLKNTSGNTITSSDTVIASGFTNYVYTITHVSTESSTKYYTISPDSGDNAGKFLASTGDKNKAQFLANTDTSDERLWSISYSSGFVITNKYNAAQSVNATLRCNDSNGWAAYSSTQATNGAPSLFEKVETPSGVRSLIRLTATGPADNAKTEDYVMQPSDFTATALFDTGATETVTPTIVSGATLSKGSNTVRLSYTDPNDNENIQYCNVTVVAAERTAELDGIVWSQEDVDRDVFSGATIGSFGTLQKHYDDGSTIALSLSDCTVAVYSNTSGTKAHDVSNPATYTWSVSNDDGKYLGVTYDEYTVYSGVISVVETLNAVYGKEETLVFDTQLTSANPVASGDVIAFVSLGETNYQGSEFDSTKKNITATSYTSDYPTSVYSFTVGSDGNGKYTLHNEDDGYLYYDKRSSSGNNMLYFSETIDSTSYTTSWDISFDEDDNAIIKSVYTLNDGDTDTDRSIQYNYNNGAPRFSCYHSEQEPMQLFKARTVYVPTGDNIANTNATVQKAVLEFASHFNDVMNCTQAGTTTNVKSKWDSLSHDFDELLESFTGTDLNHCKALFAGADASQSGDSLQQMLARYEYIVAKYKVDDFLADIDRPPVKKSASIFPFGFINMNGNIAPILVVISMISIAAVGGYFFLRKRKED